MICRKVRQPHKEKNQLTSVHQSALLIFSSEIANGHAKKDHSHIINYFERMTNHRVQRPNNSTYKSSANV